MRISSCSARVRAGFLAFFFIFLYSTPAIAQVAPPFGQAASFAVLAGSTVTNTGASMLTGDLGVSPGLAIVGFPPGVVVDGVIHAGDAVAQGAQEDATTAYNDLAGQASGANLSGQDLGGMTLAPGVYTFSSSAQLTGTLTLDAQGDSSAVFVFQIGSTLTTASGARVEVINGGVSCNVFWQVGSSATLGTASAVSGSILALASITLNTGAQLSGRALARNGAVTLDSNDVTVCGACGIITLAPDSLPTMAQGTPFTQRIVASGGSAPYSFEVTAGTLPDGIVLSNEGVLSGTPSGAGSFTFTITATDASGCSGEVTYTVVVNPLACGTVLVGPSSLPDPVAGESYQQSLTATGGAAPYAFALTSGALPAGLVLAPDGVITGVPTETGSFTVTITATDAEGCSGSRTYVFVVNAGSCPTIVLAPDVLPALVANTPFDATLTASGGSGPYTFAVVSGSLPSGLALSSSGANTAEIAGTPLVAQSFEFTISAQDQAGCATSRTYSGTIAAMIVTASVPAVSAWSLMCLLLLVAVATRMALKRE